MTVAPFAKPPIGDITVTLKRLAALLDQDADDEYGVLQPSSYAFKTVLNWLLETYELMGNDFPKASVSTDDQGGIRLTWTQQRSDREVRLFCPYQPNQQAYIYHETDDDYAVESEVSATTLATWLNWLLGH
jgi:hypothetical protein